MKNLLLIALLIASPVFAADEKKDEQKEPTTSPLEGKLHTIKEFKNEKDEDCDWGDKKGEEEKESDCTWD